MSIIRLTIRMAVVLPQPDGPTSTQISPAGTSKERSWIAGSSAPGYVFVTSRNSSVAACGCDDGPSSWAVCGDVHGGVPGREGGQPIPRQSRSNDPTDRRRAGPTRGRRPRARRRAARAALEAERRGDQPVGEPRVLGQQRAVEVGADDVVAQDALEARGARVAVALQHAAERLLAGAQVRAPAVVLEAGEHARAVEARAGAPRSRRCRSAAGPSSRTVCRSTSPTPGISSSPSS